MIYLDSASTELLHPKAQEAMIQAFNNWANPSGINQASKAAKYHLELCRKKLKDIFNVRNNAELIFTSSATESNNIIFNASPYPILVSKFEHSSVFKHPKVQSVIDLSFDALKKKLLEKRYLVSISLVNNESGMILVNKDLIQFIKKHGSVIHLDASQAKQINFDDLGCDYMTISSHKMGGPIGVAAIISKTVLPTALYGGGQEFNIRSSTEAVPLIVGFVTASEELRNREQNDILFYNYLKKSLKARYFFSNFVETSFVNHLLCLLTYEKPGTEVQTYMDINDVVIAYGSACSSGAINGPKVLTQFKELPTQNGVRVSFSWSTKIEDITIFAELWNKLFD